MFSIERLHAGAALALTAESSQQVERKGKKTVQVDKHFGQGQGGVFRQEIPAKDAPSAHGAFYVGWFQDPSVHQFLRIMSDSTRRRCRFQIRKVASLGQDDNSLGYRFYL